MKKTGKIFCMALSLLILAVILCGCGQAAEHKNAQDVEYYGVSEDSNESAKALTKSQDTSAQVTQNRKIIEYIDLTVETKTFDKLIDDINAEVTKAGGYIESSQIDGNGYYDLDRRTAQLKIRIPKTKQSGFSEFITESSNVVSRSVNTDDVTDRYIDTQSRIKALTLEKETLEKLITQSANVSDTLTVYEKLTDVIAEIESYQGKLNEMDNLIDYITFTVYINEVEKETEVKKQNWFVSTWNDLLDNFSDLGNGMLAVISFVIAALPYWLLVALIAVAVIITIRRRKNKKAKNSEEPQQ